MKIFTAYDTASIKESKWGCNNLIRTSFQKLFLIIFKWLSPIGLFLISTTYQDNIRCTWFHGTFFTGSYLTFLILSYKNVFNKYCIPGTYLIDLVLCDFCRRSPILLGLINTTYYYHIWWTWFLATFSKIRFKHFWLSPFGSC